MCPSKFNKKKNIISIQKTNNYYYSSKGSFNKIYSFTSPKKIDLINLRNNELIVVPYELMSDEIIKNIDPNVILKAEFNPKNIDILIKENLLENKLIKPLYLS